MKKIFHFAAIALVASALTVACNSSNNTEDTTAAVDTTAVDSIAVEDTVATDPIAEVVEQPAQQTKAKAVTKKDDKKEMKATTEAPAKDVNANAQSRLAKQQAEKTGLKEAAPAKNAYAVPDANKNAANRLKR